MSEVLVVDGGSSDNTALLARKAGAKVLLSPAGRAKQMNKGWRHAQGACIMFLHADCKLPARYKKLLHTAAQNCHSMTNLPPLWGCFETIDADVGGNLQRAVLKYAVKARTRWRHMPYGDQAIFVQADLLRQLGGFKDLPIMEDYELVTRLRKCGRPAIVPHAMEVSGRRWRNVGFIRTLLTNQAMIIAFHCGVPMDTLASWYRGPESAATDSKAGLAVQSVLGSNRKQ